MTDGNKDGSPSSPVEMKRWWVNFYSLASNEIRSLVVDGVDEKAAKAEGCRVADLLGWPASLKLADAIEVEVPDAAGQGSETYWKVMAQECLRALTMLSAHYDDLESSNPGFLGRLCLQRYDLWNDAHLARRDVLQRYAGTGIRVCPDRAPVPLRAFTAFCVEHSDGTLHGGEIPCFWVDGKEAKTDSCATIGGSPVKVRCFVIRESS